MTIGGPQAGDANSPSLASTRAIQLISGLSLAVLLLAGGFNVWAFFHWMPRDPAAFASTAVSSTTTAVYVVLSFFVLLVTQSQLRNITANSAAERSETAEQLKLARDQLAEARTQAASQADENRKSQELARRSNQESMRARLDTLAPRVTLRRDRVDVEYQASGTTTDVLPPVADLDQSDGSIVVRTQFIMQNFGDEPALLMLQNPWAEKYGYYKIIEPGEIMREQREFFIRLWDNGLRRYANTGWPELQGAESPWQWTIKVHAQSVGGEVKDELTWSGSIHLYSTQPDGAIIKLDGPPVNDVPLAHRARTYRSLEADPE